MALVRLLVLVVAVVVEVVGVPRTPEGWFEVLLVKDELGVVWIEG